VTGRDGTRPGSIIELPAGIVTDKPSRWLPVNEANTWAAAALKVEWPETFAGSSLCHRRHKAFGALGPADGRTRCGNRGRTRPTPPSRQRPAMTTPCRSTGRGDRQQ
jgi:hypothetical protein